MTKNGQQEIANKKIPHLLPDHLHHVLAPPQLGHGAFRIVETVEKNFGYRLLLRYHYPDEK